MKVAIVGTGGVGGYFGGHMARTGTDVRFVARGAHLKALKADGLTVLSDVAPIDGLKIQVTDDPKEIGPVDAVLLAVLAGVVHAPQPAHAALLPCGLQQEPDAARQAQALQIAALVREELERSGSTVALVARSGLDLARFGQRYSHAGLSLRHNPASPWAVRQLYYACDERRSRVFDQGLAAFLLGTEDPAHGFMSVVLPEPQQAQALERAALDDARALSLLGASYSANAYAFGLRHQNCNQ